MLAEIYNAIRGGVKATPMPPIQTNIAAPSSETSAPIVNAPGAFIDTPSQSPSPVLSTEPTEPTEPTADNAITETNPTNQGLPDWLNPEKTKYSNTVTNMRMPCNFTIEKLIALPMRERASMLQDGSISERAYKLANAIDFDNQRKRLQTTLAAHHKSEERIPESKPAKAAQPAPKDSFVEKFAKEPYFRPDRQFAVVKAQLESIAKKAGVVLIEKGEAEDIISIQSHHDKHYKELLEICDSSVSRAWHAAHMQQHEAIKTGGHVEALPDREQMERELYLRKQHIKAQLKSVETLMVPIMHSVYSKLEKAARQVAVDLDKTERENSDAFGVQFFPSLQLCLLVWLAIDYCPRGKKQDIHCMLTKDLRSLAGVILQ